MSRLIEIKTPDGLLTFIGSIEAYGAEPGGMTGDGDMYMDVDGFRVTVVRDGEVRLGDESPLPVLPGEYRLTQGGLLKDGLPLWI